MTNIHNGNRSIYQEEGKTDRTKKTRKLSGNISDFIQSDEEQYVVESFSRTSDN